MQDANSVLAIIDLVGSDPYLFGALVVVILAAIIFGLPLLERSSPTRRRR